MKRTLKRAELADLVARYSLVLRPNKRSFVLKCPMEGCEREKLYVEKTSGRSICFHCGMRGYADFVLSRILSLPVADLSESLYGDTAPPGTLPIIDLDLEDWWREYDDGDVYLVDGEVILPETVPNPDHRPLAGTAGEAYLGSRGISLQVATEYGITYDSRSKRVVFPIVINGTLVGWQARTTIGAEPKILTQGQVGGKVLMFQDRLNKNGLGVGSQHAILCEGPVDAIKCHLAGGNVAAMGKGVTPQQIALILKRGIQKLYIGLDPDAADDVMRVIREVAGYDDIKIYIMEPPRGFKDLGDLSLEAAYEVYQSATRAYPGQLFVHF